MTWYVDPYLAIDVRYLVEAHCMNGQGEFDGIYMISCLVKHHDVLKEVGGMYPTREVRESAFQALGERIAAAAERGLL